MSMSLLVFGVFGSFIGYIFIKSIIPSKEERKQRKTKKTKENFERRVSGYEQYLTSKGIKWQEDMDSAILALAARESFLAAIVFYMHKVDTSISSSKKHVEKLCLENGVNTESYLKLGHTSVLSSSESINLTTREY